MLMKLGDSNPYTCGRINGLLVISDKCPSDVFEEYKRVDNAWYEDSGEHIYWNFTDEAIKDTDK